ncbi:hypothetical protein LZP73_13255 [Shewanella sp. AS16]|uniref:hypothetical protein n=1 Tax=Shewanella sp. AS16 TaxID=2907625 RepID=UPI001F2D2DFA|nr:hypothetical protein [Shewanella sp. AS16]MCE9687160.1 hypothetical protein [Shewanella sp. AS16]
MSKFSVFCSKLQLTKILVSMLDAAIASVKKYPSMKIFKTGFTLCIVSAFSMLTSCSSLPEGGREIAVSYEEPARLQFQGKGAGAGFALMSTMGAMGIALGVAIDEGIAKDIRSVVLSDGFSLDGLISKALRQKSKGRLVAVYDREFPAVSMPRLIIERYGFKTTGGENDATSADILVSFVLPDIKPIRVHYPDDFKTNEGFTPMAAPLAALKQDGERGRTLLEAGFNSIFDALALRQPQYF